MKWIVFEKYLKQKRGEKEKNSSKKECRQLLPTYTMIFYSVKENCFFFARLISVFPGFFIFNTIFTCEYTLFAFASIVLLLYTITSNIINFSHEYVTCAPKKITFPSTKIVYYGFFIRCLFPI